MQTVDLDYKFFPLVIMRWPDTIDDAGLNEYFKRQEAAGARALREKTFYATVVLTTGDLGAAHRKKVAQWTRTMPKELRERVIGSFVVIAGPVQRGILMVLKHLVPDLKEVYPSETVRAAVEAATAKLAERKIALRWSTDEIVRYIG